MFKKALMISILFMVLGAAGFVFMEVGEPKNECAEEGQEASGFVDSDLGCAVSTESLSAQTDWITQTRTERAPVQVFALLVLTPLGFIGSLISGLGVARQSRKSKEAS